MAYDLATVTNSGNQLLASVVPDKSSLVIDKIEVSGTKLASSTDLKTMTSISNVVQTLSANGYQKKDNSFIISTVLDNSSVDADYQAWVFGIWAHKADGGSSVLMSVITSTDSPDTISKGAGTPIDYNYKFITTFSNTKSLKIKMSSDTYATNDTVLHNSGDETATGTKTFQEIKISNKKFPSLVQTDGQYVTLDGGNTEIVPADNSKVVHTTGDETIDGKKKFNIDPTDGAGNAYAKTVDVNQQLDKKVNVADMRKPASDVAGIEEVNAKQDKIGYTPADDSKVVHSKDMRKPASDVAGIGEVNAKQDKIGYTPADDSKVAHLSGANNFDTVPTVDHNPLLLASSLPSDIARTGQANTFNLTQTFSQGAKTLQTGSYDDANSLVNEGLYYNTNSSIKNGAGSLTTGYIQVMSGYGKIVRQIMYSDTDGGVIYDRTSQDGGSSWSDWTQIITWDQLPSNMVLNNQDTNFTAKLQQNGQDVALANNTIYRNPDTGSVSTANTFTAQQTFSIAPTIKDASKDKGDNQAATMADLKSVENSAWHLLKTKDVGGDFDINMLYFKNYKWNYIRIIFLADEGSHTQNTYSNYRIVVDMSKVITSFGESDGITARLSLGSDVTGDTNGPDQGTANFVIATISGTSYQYESVQVATDFSSTGSLGDFRGIDFKVNGFI